MTNTSQPSESGIIELGNGCRLVPITELVPETPPSPAPPASSGDGDTAPPSLRGGEKPASDELAAGSQPIVVVKRVVAAAEG